MNTKRTMWMALLVFATVFAMMSSVYAADTVATLKFEFISQTPDPVEPGNFVELRWRVINEGGLTENYVFELNADYPFSIDETTTSAIQRRTIDGSRGGENSDVLYYRVRVAEDAVEGDSNIVRLNYKRDTPGSQSISIEENIRIQSRQGLVEISNVEINPSEIAIGSRFTVSLTLSNLGTSAINNLKLALDTDDTGFTPIGSSNQKIVSLIGGKQSRTIDFEFFADGNTEVKVYAIPVTAEYTDSLGRSNSIETDVGFPIDAKPYYLYNLEKTDVYTAGSQGQIIASISNIGKSDINFVVLELMETDDYVVLTTQKTYLGNLESDDFETGQYDIYVKDTEKNSIPLVFTARYRDAYDKTYTEEFSIDLRLFDSEEAQRLGLIQGSSSGGFGIIIVLIILVGGFFWWRARKKKKSKK